MINLIRKDAYMKSLFFLKNHLNFWLYWGIMRDEVFVLNHARLEGNGTGLHCQKKVREKWSMRLQGNLSWKSVEHMWFLHSHPWIIPKQNFFFSIWQSMLTVQKPCWGHTHTWCPLNKGYEELVLLYKIIPKSHSNLSPITEGRKGIWPCHSLI